MSDKTRSLRRNLRKIKHKRVKNFIAQIINIFNYFKTKKTHFRNTNTGRNMRYVFEQGHMEKGCLG